MPGLINWGQVGQAPTTVSTASNTPLTFSGSRINWSALHAQAIAAPAPFDINSIKDVPSLNKALQSKQIDKNQWLGQFNAITKNNVKTPKYTARNTTSALGGALNKVLVKPAVAVGRPAVDIGSGQGGKLVHDTAQLGSDVTGGTLNQFSKAVVNTPVAVGREVRNKPITDIQQHVFGTTNQGDIAKKIIGSTVGTGSLAVGGGALGGTRTLAAALRRVAPTAAAGVVGNVGSTLASNPKAKVSDLIKSGVVGGALGAGLPFAGAGVSKALGAASGRIIPKVAPVLSSEDQQIRAILKGDVVTNRAQNLRSIEQNQATMTPAQRLAAANGDTGQAGLMLPQAQHDALLAKFQDHSPAPAKTSSATPVKVPNVGEQGTKQGSTPANVSNLSIERPSIESAVGTAKNPVIPKVTTSDVIPKEGKFKNLISVSGDLSRQGKSGKEIANRLQKAEATSETGQAQFLKKIPTVTSLKGKNFSNFVDTLGRLSKVEGKPGEQIILKSLDPKTKQAVSEYSKTIPEPHRLAVQAGVDTGNLGKYYFPRNYNELLSTKRGLADAAQHLVKSGQAKSIGEAVQSLKFAKSEYNTPFGHFEKSRNFDLPNYDKSKNALVNYISGAYNKIGHAEQFGPKGEVANTLIGQIGQEGRDADRALKNYQIATGQYKYHNPGVDTALSKVRGYNRITKLGLSSILNATQSVNTAAVAGTIRTAKAALKQLSKPDRDYIETTGVRVDSVINALREQTGATSKMAKSGNFVKKVLGKTLSAPGFGAVEKFNRGVAAVAGRDYADSLAARGTPRATNVLRNKLGVEGNIGRKLTEDQQIQASRKLVELTQFKTGAKDLPGWADSPMGKTVAQFRTFSYKQTGFVYNELLKTAIKGNPVPLMRFIAVGVPVGVAAGGARNVLGGKPFYGDTKGQPKKEKLLGATFTGSSNVGGTGLAGAGIFLAQNAKSPNIASYVAGDIGGPTAGLAASLVQAGNNKTKLERLGLGQVPVAGPYLKTKFTPFGSAQQRSFNSAASESEAKALSRVNYSPPNPSDTRSKDLQKSDPKKYQQLLDRSNKLFVQAIQKAQRDPRFNSENKAAQKRDLSASLSAARKKALDQMDIPKPKKTKQPKATSYVR